MKNVIIILTAAMFGVACDGAFQSGKIDGYCDEQYDAGYDDADADNANVIAQQAATIADLQAQVAELQKRMPNDVAEAAFANARAEYEDLADAHENLLWVFSKAAEDLCSRGQCAYIRMDIDNIEGM